MGAETFYDDMLDRLALAPRERDVLRVLLAHVGRVVSRSELVKRAQLRDREPRYVDVLLVSVRRIVGSDNLRNVRGRGWLLAPAAVERLSAAAARRQSDAEMLGLPTTS